MTTDTIRGFLLLMLLLGVAWFAIALGFGLMAGQIMGIGRGKPPSEDDDDGT